MKTITKLLLTIISYTSSFTMIAQKGDEIAINSIDQSTASTTLSIKGDKLFCTTSSNYFIENLPKNGIVQWKAFPKGIVTIMSPNSRQTTLTKVSDGNITLSAIVTYNDTATVFKKSVTVGNPFPKGTLHVSANTTDATYSLQAGYTYFMSSTSDYSKTTFSVTDNRYSTFTWKPVSLPPPSSGLIWGGNGSVLQVNFGAPTVTSNSFTAVIEMQAQGPCGLYTQNFSVTNVLIEKAGSAFSLHPNPANQSTTIEISSVAKIPYDKFIYAVKIIDHFGGQRKVVEFKNGISSVKISLADLNPGIYSVLIFDGKNWNSKQLLIQR
jgi:hypothetical protein